MKEYIDKYLNYLSTQKNYSMNTILCYEEDLNLFNNFLCSENLSFLNITYSDIRFFYNYLDKHKYSKNSISRKISSIRSFYKYLAFNHYIKTNPFNLVKLPKKDNLLPKFLYYNELIEMFDSMMDSYLDIRNRAILEVLYATGIRVSELCNIKLSNIDFDNRKIKVFGKGSKERIVYFGSFAYDSLINYLNNSRLYLLKDKSSDYLFINNRGTRLSPRGVELIIEKIIKNTSIKTKITPHTLRHTFATHLLNNGCDILVVQELLGHESLRATQVYTHITNDSLKNIYQNSHPRNKKGDF